MTDTPTATRTFARYGIPDGSVLVQRTERLLTGNGGGTVTDSTLSLLEAAFRTSFLELAAVESVPPDVAAAVEDAAYFTREEYAGTHADLRTEVVASFYRSVAEFHHAYREHTAPVDDPAV